MSGRAIAWLAVDWQDSRFKFDERNADSVSATLGEVDASAANGALVQAASHRLVIVGGGMAAYGLCQSISTQQDCPPLDIKIIGDEPTLPYDRVGLSKMLMGKSSTELLLQKQAWYDQRQIVVKTNCRVTSIDRQAKLLIDDEGRQHSYDQLVLATGSHPFVPPVPGSDSPGVFVYRTIDDLTRIKQFVARVGAARGAVIGGGLLGLEAAKILHDLGLRTSVIEMAPGLMPRQLDSVAARRLRQHVESIGVDVQLVRRTQRIESRGGSLRIYFANAAPTEVDILVIAAGVRPNDGLAGDAGLEIGKRGGIVVDEQLRTSDPSIFAIGECASFRGHVYGLVAPCYRMAETLAANLAGQNVHFGGADESAELKLMGVQVVTLGRAIGQSAGGIVLSQEDDTAYRRLLIEKGKIVGAACVGPWEDLAQIRHAVQKQRMLWPIQRTRFRHTGSPWSPGGSLAVQLWPSDATVCSCIGVTRGQITQSIQQGASTADQIAAVTRASTACGSCRSLVCQLVGDADQPVATPGAKTMLVASIVSAALILLMLVLEPIKLAASVQDSWRNVDVLWRDDFYRQVTGFSTLGLTLIGLLFSLRKRLGWFQLGSYTFWRGLHGVLGAAVLVAIAVHTGLRLGENLNFLLGVVFILVALVGSVVGVMSSLESKTTGQWALWFRRWRPRLTTLHTMLFWPLPALVAVHIFTFYWFSD